MTQLTEANFSQRHEGVWDDGKYRLQGSSSSARVNVSQDHTVLEGLQISQTHTGWNSVAVTFAGDVNVVGDSLYIIADHGTYGWGRVGVNLSSAGGMETACHIFKNSIIEGINNTGNNTGTGIYSNRYAGENSATLIYNNTVIGHYDGIYFSYSVKENRVINNVSIDAVRNDFRGSYHSVSNHNLSSDSTAPGSNSITEATVQFVDEDNDDFRLSLDDTSGAIDGGTDLSAEMDAVDILGNTRPARTGVGYWGA
jgi:hypothetical protein